MTCMEYIDGLPCYVSRRGVVDKPCCLDWPPVDQYLAGYFLVCYFYAHHCLGEPEGPPAVVLCLKRLFRLRRDAAYGVSD